MTEVHARVQAVDERELTLLVSAGSSCAAPVCLCNFARPAPTSLGKRLALDTLKLPRDRALSPGDRVALEMDGGRLILMSFVGYLLPLVLMLSFSVGCRHFVTQSTLGLALAATTGLLFGGGVAWWALRRLASGCVCRVTRPAANPS